MERREKDLGIDFAIVEAVQRLQRLFEFAASHERVAAARLDVQARQTVFSGDEKEPVQRPLPRSNRANETSNIPFISLSRSEVAAEDLGDERRKRGAVPMRRKGRQDKKTLEITRIKNMKVLGNCSGRGQAE